MCVCLCVCVYLSSWCMVAVCVCVCGCVCNWNVQSLNRSTLGRRTGSFGLRTRLIGLLTLDQMRNIRGLGRTAADSRRRGSRCCGWWWASCSPIGTSQCWRRWRGCSSSRISSTTAAAHGLYITVQGGAYLCNGLQINVINYMLYMIKVSLQLSPVPESLRFPVF